MKRTSIIAHFVAVLAVALAGCSSPSSRQDEVEQSEPFALESAVVARASHEAASAGATAGASSDAGSARAAEPPAQPQGYTGPHPEPWVDQFGPHPEPWNGNGTVTPRPAPSGPKEPSGGGSPSPK